MQEIMKEIIRGEDIGVLATTGDTEPHCSLMAYIVDSSCSCLYFVTHKNTKKYQNLLQNP